MPLDEKAPPTLDEIILELTLSLAESTQGVWSKGLTTHHTVCDSDKLTKYAIAEFHHADDAHFCDVAHGHMAAVLAELARLKEENTKLQTQSDPAVAAIQYALETDEGLEFLRLWNQGCFPEIRKEWTDCPAECFIGADPLLTTEG